MFVFCLTLVVGFYLFFIFPFSFVPSIQIHSVGKAEISRPQQIKTNLYLLLDTARNMGLYILYFFG